MFYSPGSEIGVRRRGIVSRIAIAYSGRLICEGSIETEVGLLPITTVFASIVVWLIISGLFL